MRTWDEKLTVAADQRPEVTQKSTEVLNNFSYCCMLKAVGDKFIGKGVENRETGFS